MGIPGPLRLSAVIRRWHSCWAARPRGQRLTPVAMPASADFPLDGVAVGEGSFETVEEIWHCVLGPGGDGPRIRFGASGG